jgi:Domain of unknown function (DUF397)
MTKQTFLNSLDNVIWRKATYSNPSGSCVEVAERNGSILLGGYVHVRDSKHPNETVLRFTKSEWQAFVAGSKDGEFDLK